MDERNSGYLVVHISRVHCGMARHTIVKMSAGFKQWTWRASISIECSSLSQLRSSVCYLSAHVHAIVSRRSGKVFWSTAFHYQEWSISNFPCSLTRNITLHSMKNLAFHKLLRWKMIILPILATEFIRFSLKCWGNVLFQLCSGSVKCFCYSCASGQTSPSPQWIWPCVLPIRRRCLEMVTRTPMRWATPASPRFTRPLSWTTWTT